MSRLVNSLYKLARLDGAAQKKARKTRKDKGTTRLTPLPLALHGGSLERVLRQRQRMFSALPRGRS